jgi:hypothetical protein
MRREARLVANPIARHEVAGRRNQSPWIELGTRFSPKARLTRGPTESLVCVGRPGLGRPGQPAHRQQPPREELAIARIRPRVADASIRGGARAPRCRSERSEREQRIAAVAGRR